MQTIRTVDTIGSKGYKHFLHTFSFTLLTLWKGESIQWTPFRLLYAENLWGKILPHNNLIISSLFLCF